VPNSSSATEISGKVIGVRGPVIMARMPEAGLGDMCTLLTRDGSQRKGQIISFQDDLVMLAPCDSMDGIGPGSPVKSTGNAPTIRVSDQLKGKVLDAFGEPLYCPLGETFSSGMEVGISSPPPNPLERGEIDEKLTTGVKAIDGL